MNITQIGISAVMRPVRRRFGHRRRRGGHGGDRRLEEVLRPEQAGPVPDGRLRRRAPDADRVRLHPDERPQGGHGKGWTRAFLLGIGIFGGLAMGISAWYQGKAGASASDAFAETGKGFGNYIMVIGLIETVALFIMVFMLGVIG